MRKLVGERFDCEDVRDLPRRADVGGPQRRILEPVHRDLHAACRVRGIAVLADEAGRDSLRLRDAGVVRREQRHVRKPRGGARNPYLRSPRGDRAVGSDRAFDCEELRRALGVPAVLVFAHPLHAHRLAGRLRQQRGVRRRVVVPVHAEAARAVEVDEPHGSRRQAEHRRERRNELVGRLGGSPDRRAVPANVCDGAGGSERSMGLHRPVVGGGAPL